MELAGKAHEVAVEHDYYLPLPDVVDVGVAKGRCKHLAIADRDPGNLPSDSGDIQAEVCGETHYLPGCLYS